MIRVTLLLIFLTFVHCRITSDSSPKEVSQKLQTIHGILTMAHDRHLHPMRQLVREMGWMRDADVDLYSARYSRSLLVSSVQLKMAIRPMKAIIGWMKTRMEKDKSGSDQVLRRSLSHLEHTQELAEKLRFLVNQAKNEYESEILTKDILTAHATKFIQNLGDLDVYMIASMESCIQFFQKLDLEIV